jgi:lia operon protein LiaG
MLRITTMMLCLFLGVTAQAQKTVVEANFSLDNIESLEVEGSFCDISMESTSGSSLDFDGVIRASKELDYEIKYEQSGTHVKVWVVAPRSNNWSWGWNDFEARLNFKVPAGIKVRVDNSSGDVSIAGLEGSNHRIEASSGDIEVRKVKGDMIVRASSGDVKIDGVEGDLEVETSSGDQRIYNIGGNVRFDASSGDTRFQSIAGDLRGRTSSGEIDMVDVEGVFDVSASSGDIEGRDLIVKGGSSFVATSGDISVYVNQELEKLSFEARSSSGDIAIGEERGEDRMMIKNPGGQDVYLKSSSGDITFRN